MGSPPASRAARASASTGGTASDVNRGIVHHHLGVVVTQLREGAGSDDALRLVDGEAGCLPFVDIMEADQTLIAPTVTSRFCQHQALPRNRAVSKSD